MNSSAGRTQARNTLPTKHINELQLNYYYRIYNQKRLQTKYGEAILVYLYDYDTRDKFKVFLPKRFVEKIPVDDSDSDDDAEGKQCNRDFPRSIGYMNYFEMAFTGETKLYGNMKRYEVDFKRSDYPFYSPM